jgi:metal-responsive CopG/Arc/MetJ family transcriptional regulator
MGRRDWYYVHLPKLLIKRLDQFLQTPRAKSMGMVNKSELLRHVINEFLDEQEAFYNKMQSMEDFVLEIKDHDHIVLTFNNESQFKEIITSFVKRGIDHNEIDVLIIYRKEEQKFLQSLDKLPNINSLFNLQDIMIIPADESFHNDIFSIEPVVKRLHSIEKMTISDGNRSIDIYPVNNSHSYDMLAVYLPSEKILLTSDLYSPGFLPFSNYSKELLAFISDSGIDVNMIAGTHGSGGGGPLKDLYDMVVNLK